jgi:hypothetical protein
MAACVSPRFFHTFLPPIPALDNPFKISVSSKGNWLAFSNGKRGTTSREAAKE